MKSGDPMGTPIYDFVKQYTERAPSRLHMPGHKGVPLLGCEPYDITEVGGADALYEASGIIRESERNAARLFGSGATFYSTEGSSHGIRSMLFLSLQLLKSRERQPLILAARNVHKAFLTAAALLDLRIRWLMPPEGASLCSGQPTPASVRAALAAGEKPYALYLTSPDYLGQEADLAGIAAVCRERGVQLLVDNAHGAYLHFLGTPRHPIDCGALMCCDSAHKTLPVLTGGAYLHLSGEAAERLAPETVKNAMALFGSTSPSYLILESLDLCNRMLSGPFPQKLRETVQRLEMLKAELTEAGVSLLPGEPLKLVVNAAAMGLTGECLQESLRQENGEAEFADRDWLVTMFSPANREEDFRRLRRALTGVRKHPPRAPTVLPRVLPQTGCSVREAFFRPQEMIPAEESAGRICGAPTVGCPPAVPIAAAGEVIPEEALPLFAAYGIKKVSVLK